MPKPPQRPSRTTDPLADYRRKRRAGATPEPSGQSPRPPSAATAERGLFVVQEHHARARHFDLRLEIGGVLKSWAVPKGPSPDPSVKRFARLVEDHPLDYANFEGRIPEGNYGAGWVIVWDQGAYRAHGDLALGLTAGKLLFDLHGSKLRGRWTLVRMKTAEDWLLIKEQDPLVSNEPNPYGAESVLSGLTVEALPQASTVARRFHNRVARHRRAPRRSGEPDLRPMLASAGEPFDRSGWVFELKYDGYRLLARRDGGTVTLWSRNGQCLNAAFPEVAHAIACLPHEDLLIDGELVVLDDSGRPDFGLLQQRAALSGAAVAPAARQRPATYYAFDLPSAAGRDLRPLPLLDRKKLLSEALPPAGLIRYSVHVAGRGRDTYETALQLGLEGIVGKRADSPYRAGRSRDWIKTRAIRTDDFVIAGWTPASGNAGDIGALALAEYRGGALTYVGKAGSGLSGPVRDELRRRLAELPPGSPLTDSGAIHWVPPELVCEVAFREYTAQGHLRQPVFQRLRFDKPPHECRGRFDDPQPPPAVAAPREVTVTNRDKVFFPERGLSKGDLVDYYRAIAPWMLPYLAGRPLVLTRFPDGIHGKAFYQRDAPDFVPDWIERQVLWSESAEREVHYFIANDVESLVYLANLGTIPIHAWHSRIDAMEHPDWCVLDLDPKDAPFPDVVAAALAVRDLARELDLPAYPKTSGASGLHVLIPLGRQLTHEQAKTLGEMLARVIVARQPDTTTITRAVRQRQGKVYVDFLQNGQGKLLVAPFSVRAEAAASVSMPLGWHEVNRGLRNERFTIVNAVRRMQRARQDPMIGVLSDVPDLHGALEKLLSLVNPAD